MSQEEIVVGVRRKKLMDTAKRLDTAIYPRGECKWCGHQWQPRRIKKKGSYYFCPHCKRQFTKVWSKSKKLIGEPKKPVSETNKEGEPIKKNGVWYDKDGNKMPDLFVETNQIEEEIDKSLQKGSHVIRKGVESFPEFDSKTVILVYAKAIENGYDEEDLHEFIMQAIHWYDAMQKVSRFIGKVLNPIDFPAEFEVLISMALESRRKNEEIVRLQKRIEGYEKARELLNVQLDNEEELVQPIEDYNLEQQLAELTNFGETQ